MDTDKIIIAILILVVFGLVLYLCLRKNTCQPCLQPWTGEQLTSTFNMLSTSTILPPDMAKDKNLIQCFVSELSRKMSFKDFQTKNDAQIREIILGVKGNWSNCMKNSLMENLLSIKKPKALSNDCVKCIIGTLEQQYSPIDITNMKKEDLENIMKTVIMSCPPCK